VPPLRHVDLDTAHVWFTGREGGVSRPPYDSLNVADHVGDDAGAVAENRRRLARLVAGDTDADVPLDPARWVWLRQVHGARVVDAPSAAVSGADADAVHTDVVGLPLVVLAADCVPIALVTRVRVAAVHAGWKGLSAGVVANAVRALDDDAGPVAAVVGPCAHACHYEFGAADLARLTARFGPDVARRTVDGRPSLDLVGAASVALHEAGVGRVDTAPSSCTIDDPRWFSHRRDGRTGRQAMVVVKTR
jgi:YfiH family protein